MNEKFGFLRPKPICKNFLNSSKATLKTIEYRFLTLKLTRLTSHKTKPGVKISFFGIIYLPFDLNIHSLADRSRPKTIYNSFSTFPKLLSESPPSALFVGENCSNDLL